MSDATTRIDALRDRLPEGARDLKLNLGTVLGEQGAPGLTAAQRWGSAIAAAVTAREGTLLDAVLADAQTQGIDDATVEGARSAAAVMAMNNVYYRFTHLVSDESFRSMPARLRMNVIGKPGVPAEDFELYSLVASAINGCGACMDNHTHELRKRGMSAEAIQSAVRIAAVLHGVAVVLHTEETVRQRQAA